ncbi:hypothetical protein C5N14_14955 [Micromonospora sp. MW-13]|uniref:hypothetical protein n=1 Tax=Micromonospora sp. MW-13 TaxID=2094022 RepID=UPI000ECAC689|nr:hypothetical protein [Micromonospora sp. MW-13]RGC68216.1 hypothetical protein C5N14_14955 [Micromonospora sp. MW-13]
MIPPTRVPGSRRPHRPDETALMPLFEYSPMFGRLVDAPVEMVPLLAVLAVLHQAQSGMPVGTCVPTSHQVSGALRHLGFEAEAVAACATLHRVTDTFTEVSEVGVWKQPPVVHPDGTTNGHMIVWTPSFAQLVDATLVQDPLLLAAAQVDPVYSTPVFVEVPTDRRDFLAAQPVAWLDDRLYASWVLLPDWTRRMDPVLEGEASTVVELGALGLATDALRLIAAVAEERDLGAMLVQYPRLGALLRGERQLPESPVEPPPHPAAGM